MTHQEAINDLLDKFNFNKVHIAMTALNWKWASAEEGVPSIYELRKTARRLLEDLLEAKITNISTGGFTAKCDFIENEKYLSLKFTLEEDATFYYLKP